MKKKLLVLTLAAVLLMSAAACGDGSDENETGTGTPSIPVGTGEADLGTDANGDPVTNAPETTTPAPDVDNVTEENPTFTETNKKVYIWYGSAFIRSATKLVDGNQIGSFSEGDIVTVTGESENWYRIKYEDKDAYIAKSVAGDYDVIENMTAVDNEEIEVTADSLRVRSYPSTDGGDNTVRGSLVKGDKVTRVAKGETWSCILYTVESETETTADGNPVKEVKKYFVHNDYIKGPETAATEAPSEAPTEAATEAAA